MVPAVAAPAGAAITNAPAATIAATPIAPNDRLIMLLPPGPPKSPVGRPETSLRPSRNPLFQHALWAIVQNRDRSHDRVDRAGQCTSTIETPSDVGPRPPLAMMRCSRWSRRAH